MKELTVCCVCQHSWHESFPRGHCTSLAVGFFVVLLAAHCWHLICWLFSVSVPRPPSRHHGSRAGLSSVRLCGVLGQRWGWWGRLARCHWGGRLLLMGSAIKPDVERSFCCCTLFRDLCNQLFENCELGCKSWRRWLLNCSSVLRYGVSNYDGNNTTWYCEWIACTPVVLENGQDPFRLKVICYWSRCSANVF